MRMPNLDPRKMDLERSYVCSLLGVDISSEKIAELLEKMRFQALAKGDIISVLIPAYRADILHPIDLVEDVAIAYGYMEFEPKVPALYSIGAPDKFEQYLDQVREAAVGLGLSEVMTLMLTNGDDLFTKMSIEIQDAIEAKKPVSAEQGIIRTWLLPSLMKVLSDNRNREYPQAVFEIGRCLDGAGNVDTRIAAVVASNKSSLSQIKSIFSGLTGDIELELDDSPFDHNSFIAGRCAGSANAFFGEIDPKVLVSFGLEVPVSAFEMRLD